MLNKVIPFDGRRFSTGTSDIYLLFYLS